MNGGCGAPDSRPHPPRLPGASSVKVLRSLCVAAAGLLLAACGSHNGGTSAPASANVRFVNASSDATLTVNFNAEPEYVNVPSASATSYVPVTPGSYSVTVTGTSGTLASP